MNNTIWFKDGEWTPSIKIKFSKEAKRMLLEMEELKRAGLKPTKILCFDPMIGYWQQEGYIPQPNDAHLYWKHRSHHEKEQEDE